MQALFEGVLKDRRLWQREILAGITAFFAISYIIVVNPIILADAGMPAELSVFATIFSSIIGCPADWQAGAHGEQGDEDGGG